MGMIIRLSGLVVAACLGFSAIAAAEPAATRVRRDLGERDPQASSPLAWYAVPALSPVKRLAGTFPVDGVPGGELQLIATPGEFEPASFVVFAFKDITGASLRAAELRGAAGSIPAAAVDLKIVKIWYQGGTGWYSYFADQTGRTLVPELLLNDETLIKVDHATRDNYLRVDHSSGTGYVWISNPLAVDVPFNTQTAPVADAPSIQPFALAADEFKQFWMTVNVPADAVPGIYTGGVLLAWPGGNVEIPVRLRVLPFTLPEPGTYYDPEREFYTLLYNRPGYAEILSDNGGDPEHAARKLLAIYRNMRDHNILHPLFRDLPANFNARDEASMTRQLELMREAGLKTSPIFGAIPGFPALEWMQKNKEVALAEQVLPESLLQRVDAAMAIIRKTVGDADVYCIGWDEPAPWIVKAQRKFWEHLHARGLKIMSTGHSVHLQSAGYNQDMINYPGPVSREKADAWHYTGGRILNYAGPHTGPENPDFMRRVHGLQLYKANYDGIGNYILDCTRWNDFLGDVNNFRAFGMTYGTRDDVLDTLHWEGMREAVDDVRYATLLRQLARRTAAGPPAAVYAGRQALLWLELLDEKSADLDTVRLEMIHHILGMREALDAAGGGK